MGRRSLCECKGCGAKIVWMYTISKRMVPVDYMPEYENIDQFDEKKMVTHFITCPRPGDHKKKKERK